MATVTCAISGIKMTIPHLPITLSYKAGYYHPVFLLKQRHLWNIYRKHCEGQLTNVDSYLLFLALLHSTSQVSWGVPTAFNPNTDEAKAFLECNLKQLVDMIQLTNTITIPSFKQPSFIINIDTADLKQIPNWIASWTKNIDIFRRGRADSKQQDSLQKTENRLSYFIKSGIPKESYSQVVASWASKAADFPKHKKEAWCKIIRASFNAAKMFSTPLEDLREIKAYCEANIPTGSIHSHTLYEMLREGISRHTDYLGMNPLALGYTLLSNDISKNETKVAALLSTAPVSEPVMASYPSKLAFLKAKSAWLLAKHTEVVMPEVEAIKAMEDSNLGAELEADSLDEELSELLAYDPSDNTPVGDL